jgi:hypothetical protein
MDADDDTQIYGRRIIGDRAFWFAGLERIGLGKISQANWTFWPAKRAAGPFISAIAIFRWCVPPQDRGDDSMALSNEAQIAMEQGMLRRSALRRPDGAKRHISYVGSNWSPRNLGP